ncbi:PaaI family thioesterase [Cytobacillus spongiae]|jgi:uncharacterized protein (TIGR00369 family)|uniref:PaaI family thioesterase n=1 Tax=Cytobacillus spongiae TaxID=2901381 RepID=UPI001F2AA778|nr:PaaI family thioesterase [Cytobacillus spongiae]UII57287.1 PaaI family thioesterase [Cytobacillus spongiae]
MKDEIKQLTEEYLEHANKEDLEILKSALQGLRKKQTTPTTYLGGLLHMERTMTKESCEITIPINQLLDNSLGIVHGGITATLLDTAMGSLANYILPEGYGAVTSQLNIYYLATGQGDYLSCKAKIDHQGKKTMVISADVFRSDGRKIAQASGIFFIIEKNPKYRG